MIQDTRPPQDYVLVQTVSTFHEMMLTLQQELILGIDTEFIRETTYQPKLALIQCSTADRVWLLDPLALSKETLRPFLDLITDPTILKVMHTAFADQECFYRTYEVIADPVLDVAIAAALLGLGDHLGLQPLIKKVLGAHISKGWSRTHWLKRPLSSDMLKYAAEDVLYLVPLGKKLQEWLEQKNRMGWALEESKTSTNHWDDGGESLAYKWAKTHKLSPSALSVLVSLFEWREKVAKKLDRPRQWICQNDTLFDLSQSKPATLDQLKTFRGLSKKIIQMEGKNIIAHIVAAEATHRGNSEPSSLQMSLPGDRGRESGRHPTSTLRLIEAYLSYLAEFHQISTRYLISNQKIPHLLNLLFQGLEPQSWTEQGILTPHAYQLIGPDLYHFLRGRIGLKMEREKVQQIKC